MVTAAGAVGGAMGFGLGLSPPYALHTAALLEGASILDVVFIAPVFAALGLLAGTVMALGLSVGDSDFHY